MTDRIEKTIDIKAPVARVWRALTDHMEFGAWFRPLEDVRPPMEIGPSPGRPGPGGPAAGRGGRGA